MSLKQETKQAIADALAEAIHAEAKHRAATHYRGSYSHYTVEIDDKGFVEFELKWKASEEQSMTGWIPLDEESEE